MQNELNKTCIATEALFLSWTDRPLRLLVRFLLIALAYVHCSSCSSTNSALFSSHLINLVNAKKTSHRNVSTHA